MIAEAGQCEAQVIARRCKTRVQLHRAHKRVTRLAHTTQCHQRVPQPVPRVGAVGVALQHLAVQLAALLRPLGPDPKQPQVQKSIVQLRLRFEGTLKRQLRPRHIAAVRAKHTDVVPGQSVAAVDFQGAAIARLCFFQPPHLMERDAPLVPDLRAVLEEREQGIVTPERALGVPLQQSQLRLRLVDQARLLPRFAAAGEFLASFLVQPAGPEGDRQAVVRERPLTVCCRLRSVAGELGVLG